MKVIKKLISKPKCINCKNYNINKTNSINHSNEIDSEIEKYGCDGKENNSKDKLYYDCLRKDGLIL